MSKRVHSMDVVTDLKRHLDDYQSATGTVFDHFYCPILHVDEDVELCMGHVVNQELPNTSRVRVVQRKDVDGFYGSVAEADFVTLIKYREGPRQSLADVFLTSKVRPQIRAGNHKLKWYIDRGNRSPSHTTFYVPNDDSEPLKLVLAKTPEEISALADESWETVVDFDCSVASVVSLIKAGFLTLFNMLGYSYVFSAAGMMVGKEILGKFFRLNQHKSIAEARQGAPRFFQEYIHMVRPVEAFEGERPLGTLQDNRAMACIGTSGRPFALVVSIRAMTTLHAVLMPAFIHPDSIEAYLSFLKNENETLHMCPILHDAANNVWRISPVVRQAHWPKSGVTFQQ